MKKNYVQLIVAILFATNLMAQNVPNYVPTNGLVGWWPFNGNANDESGNGNNGTLLGGTSSSVDRNNSVNSAINVDGIDCNVNSKGISLPNQIDNSKPYSISLWYKTNDLQKTYQTLIGTNPHTYIALNFNYCDNKSLSSWLGNNNGWLKKGCLDNNLWSINNNELWHNVILIKKVDFVEYYFDGLLIGKTAINSSYNIGSFNLTLGAINGNGSVSCFESLKGNIDDIAIYNRALTFAEITALYTSTPPCTNPSAVITPQGNTTFCQGGFLNLNASTGANYTYEWYNNGQLINGASTSVYQATTSGNYTVKVIDGACNATSTATTVTVNQYPSSEVNISGNTTFCEGNSVTLTAQGNGTYLWSNGETSKSLTIYKSGVYVVAITSNGCVSNSNQTTITINPNPTATITPQGNTTFCQGGFVNLVASGGSSYQWNTGSSVATISATQSGTYTVNVFNSFGCQATASQQVTVNSLPNVTLNALNQFTLKNASLIQLVANPTGGTFSGDGVQGTTFNPANATLGKKTITYNYTTPQGCSGSASKTTIVADTLGNVCSVTKYDTVKVVNTITKYDTITTKITINDTVGILKLKFKLTTGMQANQIASMTLYPNPTTNVLHIEVGDAKALEGYRYRILDALGKVIYNEIVKNSITEIPLMSLGAAGMYQFEVLDQKNTTIQTNKIVLQ